MVQDDAALVERVLLGDRSAFGPLIDRHRPEALRLARRIIGDAVDAEDLTQEALLQAFLGLRALRAPDRFGPWLLGIVVNLCRMRLRAKRDWHPAEEWHGGRVPEEFTLADLQPSPEAIYEVRELQEIVLAAVRTLPNDQQQAVRMHYVDGLTLWDIGRIAGVPVGAVKVRLHRARARLRLALEQELTDSDESTSRAVKEVSMIEVTVHDVMLRAPKDDPEAEWLPGQGKKYKLGFSRVMLLKEHTGDRILPIWVGAVEGDAIAKLLAGISTFRPFTFDLMAELLKVGGTKLEKIAVTSLRDNTYYATMWVKVRNRMHEVDARPSDAVTLALHMKAPIFVTPEVLEQAGEYLLTSEAMLIRLEEIHRKSVEKKRAQPEETEMEWRSFQSLPRGDMGGGLKPAEK
jgi:RNA polymerase sigma factor (sigma-70 family)